jgi:hypothetical protein
MSSTRVSASRNILCLLLIIPVCSFSSASFKEAGLGKTTASAWKTSQNCCFSWYTMSHSPLASSRSCIPKLNFCGGIRNQLHFAEQTNSIAARQRCHTQGPQNLLSRRKFGLAAASGLTWNLLTLEPAQAIETNTANRNNAAAENSAYFYMKWQYSQPADILPYIYANAKQGDADAILAAMDEFGQYYPM